MTDTDLLVSVADLRAANPEAAEELDGTQLRGAVGLTPAQRDACADKWAIVDEPEP